MKTAVNTGTIEETFKLEPFFELSHDLLCIAGYDGYFKKVNPAFKKLLGYSDEVLFSRPINYFVHPEDQDRTSERREQLRKKRPLLNFENRYVSESGKVFWLSWTSIPVEDDRLIYAIAKNVTHKKKLEEERIGLLSEISQTNEKLKLLNYTTSHDLRSPVANQQSIFGLLDVSRIQDPETLEILELLKDSTENLNTALNQYLHALGNGHDGDLPVEDVHLRSVFKRVCNSIHSLIESSSTSFEVDFSAFERVQFNPGHLESIFLNLITNSIKYAKPDQNALISISTRYHEGVKQLIFSDNGIGIDLPKVKDRIFGLGQGFGNHSDSKGIGLYLVHNYVTSLGGQIAVESEPGEGTRFIISFGKKA